MGAGAAVAGAGLSGLVRRQSDLSQCQPLRDVAARLPLEGVLVETDAPWLAPAPDRGKRNEPAWVLRTAQTLAGLKAVTEQEIAYATTKNFFRLFDLRADVGN